MQIIFVSSRPAIFPNSFEGESWKVWKENNLTGLLHISEEQAQVRNPLHNPATKNPYFFIH